MKMLAIGLSLSAIIATAAASQTPSQNNSTAARTGPTRIDVPYGDARPIIESLREELLPTELRARTSAQRQSMWPGWVAARDKTIRARVTQGDEDSIFNFLLFGTSFTAQPRVRDVLDSVRNAATARIVQQRLDDMVAGLAMPGGNERLRLVRDFVERKRIAPDTAEGKRQARLYLVDVVARVVKERDAYERTTRSVQVDPAAKLATHSTLYHDRGLSSDTSIFPSFAIEQALRAIRGDKMLGNASIRRVAIVGPGLDFTDKEDGYDFYPLQTIQPLAAIDSLVRLQLATRDQLRVTTFDLSPRVNGHLRIARERALAGSGYVLTLPRNQDERWSLELLSYWRTMGDRIGRDAPAVAAPPNAGHVELRSVRVDPAVVLATGAEDVNVVLQRRLSNPAETFDLIIATNVLVYYDVFEQSLALANLAAMLRRGGLLLSNNVLTELPATPMTSVGFTDVGYTDAGDGDRIIWYRRDD
jgi:hypothetical protein